MNAPAIPAAAPAAAVQGKAIPSPKQLVVIVWAYRFWVLWLTLSLVALAAIGSQTADNVYRATASLLVGFSAADDAPDSELTPEQASAHMQMQMELARSPRTLLLAVEKLRLQEDPRYAPPRGEDASEDKRRARAADRLDEKLVVHRGGDSRLLYISAEDADPVEAARLANGVADAFTDPRLRKEPGSNREIVDYFGSQLESLQARLLAAQDALNAYRQRAGAPTLSGSESPAAVLEGLNQRLAAAEAKRQRAQQELEFIEEEEPLRLESEAIRGLQKALDHQTSDLARLRITLGNRHPDIVALQRSIEESRTKLQAEILLYGNQTREELAAMTELVASYRQELNRRQQRSTVVKKGTEDERKRLETELQDATRVYQTAFESYDRLRSAPGTPFRHADLDAHAVIPDSPIRPDLRRNLLIAGLAGLLLGTIASLAWEFLNRRIRCREDLERSLGVPVLAELPSGA